ncbi:unnamed protein product [Dovyalis caffra]|uniref:Uncharacterized protein n=1 Tax=Dovyalis caffra TaxID=77055 RepID=A0AAV1RRP1_9ROSI|nr:unnamed protein product [Dovyalis caffra]
MSKEISALVPSSMKIKVAAPPKMKHGVLEKCSDKMFRTSPELLGRILMADAEKMEGFSLSDYEGH